jgi:hypothetical protein
VDAALIRPLPYPHAESIVLLGEIPLDNSVPPSRASITPLRIAALGGADRTLWILLGAAALAFIVAMINVASLFAVRAIDRQQELRTALGATRGRIVWQLLLEAYAMVMLGHGRRAVARGVAHADCRDARGANAWQRDCHSGDAELADRRRGCRRFNRRGAGVVLATLVGASLKTLLFGTPGSDPATFFAAGGVVVLVALVAAAGPARRAAGSDPIVLLNAE